MKRLFLVLAFCSLPTVASAQLSLVDSGTGINETITVTSNINNNPQFKLVFEAADNWGLSQWYDSVNDPNATTNLIVAYAAGSGPKDNCQRQNGLFNQTFYGDLDRLLDQFEVNTGCLYPSQQGTMTILKNTPSLIILETAGHPMGVSQSPDTNVTGTIRYHIYASGEIYVRGTVSVVTAQDLGNGGTSDLFEATMTLQDPTQTGTVPPDSQGFIRATSDTNPWDNSSVSNDAFVFAYWDGVHSGTFNNYTKASVLMSLNPSDTGANYQIRHSWGSGTGFGTTRWGYRLVSGPNLGANGTLVQNFLMQLGTQSSSYLPNINTIAQGTTITSAYRSPPTLTLTNATGGVWTPVTGYWTATRTTDPVTISANGALYNPAYLISTWPNGTPSTITVNGVTKNIGVDYSASKYDNNTLIIQYLDGNIPSGQNVVLSMPAAGNPVLSPSPAVAFAGQAITINCVSSCGSSGTWACTGCGGALSGNTNTSVTYTAAGTTITPQDSLLGYQLLPNNHIYNTNISGLPACAGSAACNNSTSAQLMGSVGTATVNFLSDFSTNPVKTNPLTASDNLVSYYTTANDGSYVSPQFPNVVDMEGSWYGARQNVFGADHHIITEDVQTGNMTERYQYYCTMPLASASITDGAHVVYTPASTPLFGANPLTCGLVLGGHVCIGGFTGADTWANQCPAFPTAVTISAINSTSFSTVISHANASTTTTGNVTAQSGAAGIAVTGCLLAGTCNTQSEDRYTVNDYPLQPITTDAAGLLIEPLVLHFQEFEEAVINSGSINHALRMTLGNGFIAFPGVFSWPAQTSGSAGAGGSLSYYGERFRLKSSFNCGFQNGVSGTTFSAGAQIICTAFKNFGLILADGGTNWQTYFAGPWTPTYYAYIQEINNANIATTNWEVVDESSLMVSSSSGETTNNREDVVFTRNDSVTATQPVTLQGVAVNMKDDQLLMMAGTPAQQLVAYINGASNLALSWTMNPTVGSIGASTGIYTPPANQATPTTTTVKACSVANSAICSHMFIMVFPGTGDTNPGIRIIPASTTDYTDSTGKLWKGQFGLGLTNIPGAQGCCQSGQVTGITDSYLWSNRLCSSFTFGDYNMNQFRVPAGKYAITYNYGTNYCPNGTGTQARYFGAQGVQFAGPIDAAASLGAGKPYTLGTTVTVASDNVLRFYVVSTGGQFNETGDISSFSITPITVSGSTVAPNSAVAKGTSVQ